MDVLSQITVRRMAVVALEVVERIMVVSPPVSSFAAEHVMTPLSHNSITIIRFTYTGSIKV